MTISTIEIKGLNKQYGDIQALRDINLTINGGSITALLGPNGAGKTTFIEHLLGRQIAQTGTIAVQGHSPGSYPARASIGTIMQSTEIPSTLTVEEHIELFSSYYPAPLPINRTLEIASLTDLRTKRFDKLSGGQKQRVYFAIAICGNPQFVLLDEPTVGLDVKSRRQLWDCIMTLKKEGKTILLTTHYLEEAEMLSDRLIYLKQGTVAFDGTCKQFKQRLGSKRISCTTALSNQMLITLPFVSKVERQNATTIIYSDDVVATLRILFEKADVVDDLTVTEVSLEEAVLQMDEQPHIREEEAA